MWAYRLIEDSRELISNERINLRKLYYYDFVNNELLKTLANHEAYYYSKRII